MRISFTNAAGNSVVFSEGTRHMYRIRSREGLSHIPTDLQSQRAPNQNGATLINQLFEPRDMTFDLMILGSKQEQIERRRLMNRIFNPLLGEGILHVVLDTGDEYIMSCVADGTPNFIQDEVQGVFIQEAPLDLFAPDPFWRSVRVSQTPMTAYLGLWTFPFSFPIEFGQTGDFAYIDNDGDVPCPITIEFRGPALNPRIDNVTTGEFIQINREISATQRLEINTARGRDKKIEIVDEDGTRQSAWGWINPESSLFNLVPGTNEINYSADEGADEATVIITYQKRYVGI